MTREINVCPAMRPLHLGMLLVLTLGTAFTADRANAACTMVLSVANVQMGNVPVSSLRPSSVPGYRLMSTRNQTVNVNCSVPQTTFRLELGGLVPMIGKPLVQWGTVGAMQLRAISATVAGNPVNLKFESSPANVYAQELDFTKNDIVNFDLSSMPVANRKSFSLQLQLTGLLPESHAVRSKETLESNISVQLLGAQ